MSKYCIDGIEPTREHNLLSIVIKKKLIREAWLASNLMFLEKVEIFLNMVGQKGVELAPANHNDWHVSQTVSS